MIDHASDLTWDRLLAGELTAEAEQAARAHASRCTACALRLRTLTAERDEFATRRIPVAPSRRRRRCWLVPLVPAFAFAAVALVIAVRPRSVGDDPGARPKGGSPGLAASSSGDGMPGAASSSAVPSLLLSAGRPGALAPVVAGDVIRPCDYLQAGYTAARDGFGAVLSRDGAGSVTVYVPPGGAAMVPLPAGVERSFPQSTILDETLGTERIAIVWCDTTHPLAPLRAALRAGETSIAPPGCVVRQVTLDKRAAPR